MVIMKCFNYKICKGSKVVLKNSINAESKEEALTKLEDLKKEYDGTEIKIIETAPASEWSC